MKRVLSTEWHSQRFEYQSPDDCAEGRARGGRVVLVLEICCCNVCTPAPLSCGVLRWLHCRPARPFCGQLASLPDQRSAYHMQWLRFLTRSSIGPMYNILCHGYKKLMPMPNDSPFRASSCFRTTKGSEKLSSNRATGWA